MNWIDKLKLLIEKASDKYHGHGSTFGELNSNSSSNHLPPRIVCVSHDAGFYGAQLLLLHINQVLRDQLGFRVTTILLGEGELWPQFEKTGDIVDFANPSWRVPANPAIALARKAEIKRLYLEGVRHAICNTSVSGQVLRMLKEEGFQVIALIHELPNLIREFNLEPSVLEIGQWADRVIFPAEYVRDRFIPISGLDPERAVIRPQGLYRSNPHRHSKFDARAHVFSLFGLAPDSLLVLAAGQGDRRKGIDIFCQVAAQVTRTMSKAHFVWVGDDTTALAQDCKVWLHSAGALSNVHFTGVLQDPDLYLQHIAGADIYLMTSREDPYPSVVLDAMEAGVPVVGFQEAGGFAELLAEGAGVLVPYEDRDAMAKAVFQLLTEQGQARNMGCIGQHIIDTRFYFLDYVYALLQLVGLQRRKISVIVPNYNYSRYLPTRLGTIIAQTYKPYEIIFLDDHSSDDSVAVAESILSQSGLPYRIVANVINQGCYSQWLSGVEMARGELVWIAEADDECDPTFLEHLVKGFEQPEVVLAYSQSRKIDQDGAVTRPDYLDYTDDLSKTKWLSSYCRAGLDEIRDTLAIKNTIPNASSVLMKKPDLSLIRERLVRLKNAGDWLAYVHILSTGSIYFYPIALNAHRVHIGGVTRGGNAIRHMSEIIEVQEFVSTHHILAGETIDKIERMRQFTYEYLGLNSGGIVNYREHPDLQRVLDDDINTPKLSRTHVDAPL